MKNFATFLLIVILGAGVVILKTRPAWLFPKPKTYLPKTVDCATYRQKTDAIWTELKDWGVKMRDAQGDDSLAAAKGFREFLTLKSLQLRTIAPPTGGQAEHAHLVAAVGELHDSVGALVDAEEAHKADDDVRAAGERFVKASFAVESVSQDLLKVCPN